VYRYALNILLATATAANPVPDRPQDSAPDQVLRLQVLLDRARFSPGEIDGVRGLSLTQAMNAYKKLRMKDARASEAAVLESLAQADPEPILVDYTIAEADVAGPFVDIPADMMEKAKLQALGYSSALEALGEKVHSSPRLLKRLNPSVRFVAGDVIRIPHVQRPAPPKAARVVVSRRDRSVSALDAENNVLARYPATVGGPKDPLPIGEWKINGVQRDPTFAYNPDLFWDAKPGHAKATLPAGPNGPVGVVWIDLSKESMGIHGTPEPASVGKTESHGCIRLTNWDASELADMVSPGLPARLVR
jgi:lipoprotein-anchoring transpeptidase ErfK/SrfK